MGEWVTAVRNNLAEFDDEAVPVALALSMGETEAEGLSPESFDTEVEYLIQCGFLEDMFSIDHDNSFEEHSLEFRIP